MTAVGSYATVVVTVTPTQGPTGYWTHLSLSGNLETIATDGSKYLKLSLSQMMILNFQSSDQGLYVFHASHGTKTAQSSAINVALSGRCSIIMWNNITNIYFVHTKGVIKSSTSTKDKTDNTLVKRFDLI